VQVVEEDSLTVVAAVLVVICTQPLVIFLLEHIL
jgi:hypothetical protein